MLESIRIRGCLVRLVWHAASLLSVRALPSLRDRFRRVKLPTFSADMVLKVNVSNSSTCTIVRLSNFQAASSGYEIENPIPEEAVSSL